MSVFEKLFKGKSTHAQLVETEDGGWKKHLSKFEKEQYLSGTATKLIGLGLGLTVIVGVSPLLIAAAAFYIMGANSQAVSRTHAEKVMGIQKPKQTLKNLGKHLIRPF